MYQLHVSFFLCLSQFHSVLFLCFSKCFYISGHRYGMRHEEIILKYYHSFTLNMCSSFRYFWQRCRKCVYFTAAGLSKPFSIQQTLPLFTSNFQLLCDTHNWYACRRCFILSTTQSAIPFLFFSCDAADYHSKFVLCVFLASIQLSSVVA